MQANYWGSIVWNSIHMIAISYIKSEENSSGFIEYMNALTKTIPCKECRNHLKQMLKDHPLTEFYLKNNKNLFRWTYILHDMVNQKLNKKSPEYIKMYNYYNSKIDKSGCGCSNKILGK